MGRIWTRIMTALRGGANEAVEEVIARQALRILDQEIRDAQAHIDNGRCSLANLMGKGMVAAAEVARTEERLAALTADAEMALAAGREDLALEVAGQIARLEPLRAQDAQIVSQYAEMAHSLRSALQVSEARLRDLEGQVELARATAQVQRVQTTLAASEGSSTARLQAAAQTLDDIRQRQLEAAARLEAQEELMAGDAGLERRLREAGIKPDNSNASHVLARIKAGALRSA